MATLFQYPNAAPVSAGENFAGSKIHFYQAGTTTNITTYTTAALSVAHANPVVADANGVFEPIFFNEGVNATYKMRHVRSDDSLIREKDNLPTTLNQQALGAVLYPQTAAELAAGVTPTNYYYEPGDVRRYGAASAASGPTNVTAIQAACNVTKQQGYGVIKFGPERYNLGTFGAGATTLITVTDLKNAIFDFNGGELFITVTNNDADVVYLLLNDPISIRFLKPRFIASGAVAPFSQNGPKAIRLRVSGSAGAEIGDVVLEQPYWEGLTATLAVDRGSGPATRRLRKIRIYGGVVESCYYGPNFQQAGDDFEGDWVCHNVRRAYFPYGVRRHRAKISICNDLANFNADSCVTISTQPEADTSPAPVATQDIHVDATFRGDVSQWTGLISFYHVGASAPQTFRDCSAFLNLTGVSNLSTIRPFQFKSHVSSGGAEETTTTQNIWDNIHVDALTSEGNTSGIAAGLLSLRVSPTTPATLVLGPGIKNAINSFMDGANVSAQKLDGWLFYTGLRRFLKFKTGDLTAAAMSIDLTNLNARAFSLRLRIAARADITVLSGQSTTYKDIVLTGYNASGGACVISQQDTLLTHSSGTAAGITVGVSGETLTITFTGYNNANARAIVDCEFLYPFSETLG